MTIQELERDLARTRTDAEALVATIADEPTPEQRERLNSLLRQGKDLRSRIDTMRSDANFREQIDQLGLGGAGRPASPGGVRGTSAGALFAANEEVKRFLTGGGHRRAGGWQSPAVEMPYASLFPASLFATTLTEDPASGGKLVVPQYLPGVIPTATRPVVVLDLLGSGTATSNAVIYMQETAFTNAAAAVAEGAQKPESALVFTQVSEPVLKIAHWLPTTEELLEDAPAIQSYIDARLTLGVQLAEDDQILNGNATPPNYKGLLLRATAPTITQGAGENIMDAILRQITQIATTAFVRPSGLVMHPNDVAAVQASKTSVGDYYGNGPFGPVTAPSLWNLPIAVTPAIAAKTVLVGAFSTMAQFFRKGGIRIEASNSHQDFFIKNLVAIRAEERGALACYRPAAFGKVTLL